MALVVHKYGGTSVADPERIRSVADYIGRARRRGDQVVVAVSAMGKTTDQLERLALDVSTSRPGREMDLLLSSGERISMALLTMALADLGVAAVSLTGSQAGIITDATHQRARILEVRGDRVRESLAAGQVVIVAGFQGVSRGRDVTTLGRGGTDTTAVALSFVFGAERSEIYTDVSGVFSADPRVVPNARRLPHLSWEELLEMCAAGCPKPDVRAAEFARTHQVRLEIRSSFTWEPGTRVGPEEEVVEQAIVSAVVSEVGEAKVTVAGVPDRVGVSAALFSALADRGVNVDMIVQNTSLAGHTDISFTIPIRDLDLGLEVARSLRAEIGAADVTADGDIAKVSIIGAGMRSNPGVAATVFSTLAGEDINIEMISTSPIRISVVVHQAEAERAVHALHSAFGLGS
ncbi:MAG: aspartate kinase [Actinomycetota bacterium]|nr:aspartate kinase [Actinomycetota bacterium]